MNGDAGDAGETVGSPGERRSRALGDEVGTSGTTPPPIGWRRGFEMEASGLIYQSPKESMGKTPSKVRVSGPFEVLALTALSVGVVCSWAWMCQPEDHLKRFLAGTIARYWDWLRPKILAGPAP